jgi:hypothetical protein
VTYETRISSRGTRLRLGLVIARRTTLKSRASGLRPQASRLGDFYSSQLVIRPPQPLSSSSPHTNPAWVSVQKRSSPQEKLGSRRRDEARDLAQKYRDQTSISPSLRIAKDKFLQCVLSSQRYPSPVRRPSGLESKSGISRFLQAREYRKAVEEALRLVNTI